KSEKGKRREFDSSFALRSSYFEFLVRKSAKGAQPNYIDDRPIVTLLGAPHMTDFTYAQIAKMIDHSLLQQQLTDAELEQGCKLAREYDVASVCIKPYAVVRAKEWLAGSSVAV